MDEKLREYLAELYEEELLLWDGLDDAIVGAGERCGEDNIIIYDKDKLIRILMDENDMTEDEAIEYYEFNIHGSYIGTKTPIAMTFV